MKEITIRTVGMTDAEEALLKTALYLGTHRLMDLGLSIQVVSNRMVECLDGLVLDRFAWTDDVQFGSCLGVACVEAMTADEGLTTEQAVRIARG